MRPAPTSFVSIAIVAHPDPFVVKLSGVIDMTNRDHVAALASHSANGSGTVIFDLRDIEFLGSDGIHAFLVVADNARKFRCRNVSNVVKRLLEITRLDGWLEP